MPDLELGNFEGLENIKATDMLLEVEQVLVLDVESLQLRLVVRQILLVPTFWCKPQRVDFWLNRLPVFVVVALG